MLLSPCTPEKPQIKSAFVNKLCWQHKTMMRLNEFNLISNEMFPGKNIWLHQQLIGLIKLDYVGKCSWVPRVAQRLNNHFDDLSRKSSLSLRIQ